MVEIRVPIERLREVAKSLETQRQEADSLLQSALSLVDGLSGEWSGLAQVDYAQMFNEQVPSIRARFNEILEHLASELRRIAQDFEDTDQNAVAGSGTGGGATPPPTTQPPGVVPTPSPGGETPPVDNDTEEGIIEGDEDFTIDDAFDLIGDLLDTIDWIGDRTKAAEKFQDILKQIGRILNTLTGQRGYVKRMTVLGDLLGGAKEVGGEIIKQVNTLFTLKDFAEYFSGNMTNQEVARTAVETLIPIPFLDNIIANWMANNVPDPDGKWRGLVTKVE